jgi:hypothetical protein
VRTDRCWLVVLLLVIAGCTPSTTANPDGWRDDGVQAIDGYWVIPGEPCDAVADRYCRMQVEAAVAALHAREPGAPIVQVATAGYPRLREPDTVTFAFAGLQTPRFLVVDLADGTRRVVPLMCGVIHQPADRQPIEGCVPAELELFRVGNGWMADQATGGG